MMRLRGSLRWKLLLVILLAASLPLLAAGLLLASATEAYIRSAAVDDSTRTGHLAQAIAAERGQRLLASAQAIALSPPLREAVVDGDRAAILALTVPQM